MGKSIYVVLLISATFCGLPWGWHAMEVSAGDVWAQDSGPKLAIEIPGAPDHLSWNTQTRYAISVSDPKDGESKYGEIDARACVMQIEYLPEEADVNARINEIRAQEHTGLSLMKRSTCFGCHADKTRLAGPSFAEIASRYENSAATLRELGSHIIAGSTGLWGDQVMPSHPDLTPEEAMQIARFILEQGANKNRWIYPGLQGSFRVIEKPEGEERGIYLLTASYTSTSEVRGTQSVVLKIK